MSTSRTTFLRDVSACLGRDTVPEKPTAPVSEGRIQHAYLRDATAGELREVFCQNARKAGTAIYECGPTDLNDTIIAAIAELGAGPILLADQPLFAEHQTADALRAIHEEVRFWDCEKSRESNIEYAETAAVGIATAELALAETGTVMVPSHGGCGRSVTLLPSTTVYVIHQKDIRPRLTQAMAHLQDQLATGLPSSINFVSGASSTSDIELVRVQGVHGPVRIAYIIVLDEHAE